MLALPDGYRESEASWAEVLMDLKQRGLECAPRLAVGDGVLGLWKAIAKCWPQTDQQRCWVHKTANVLEKLPKAMQPKVWQAKTRGKAYEAFDHCIARFNPKYPKAMECLAKDKASMLAFYDYPAGNWQHIRTTNPVASVFATVRLRTAKTKNYGSRTTTLTMVFKLMEMARKKWLVSVAPEKESVVSDLDCGWRWRESFAKYDLNSCSWKIRQQSLRNLAKIGMDERWGMFSAAEIGGRRKFISPHPMACRCDSTDERRIGDWWWAELSVCRPFRPQNFTQSVPPIRNENPVTSDLDVRNSAIRRWPSSQKEWKRKASWTVGK